MSQEHICAVAASAVTSDSAPANSSPAALVSIVCISEVVPVMLMVGVEWAAWLCGEWREEAL
eukprot:scaffold9896_cov57-Phaeocystis_antarctica.AAC.1